jgi:hypothetical protein
MSPGSERRVDILALASRTHPSIQQLVLAADVPHFLAIIAVRAGGYSQPPHSRHLTLPRVGPRTAAIRTSLSLSAPRVSSKGGRRTYEL